MLDFRVGQNFWGFHKIAVPPKHPKMIIFSRKNPWLLGKPTILGNPFFGMHPISSSSAPAPETGNSAPLTGPEELPRAHKQAAAS